MRPRRYRAASRAVVHLDNERIDLELSYLPFIGALLAGLAKIGPLVLVMDGSEVGRNCVTLVLSVLYRGRALPLVLGSVAREERSFF